MCALCVLCVCVTQPNHYQHHHPDELKVIPNLGKTCYNIGDVDIRNECFKVYEYGMPITIDMAIPELMDKAEKTALELYGQVVLAQVGRFMQHALVDAILL